MSPLRVMTATRSRGRYRAAPACVAALGIFAEFRLYGFHDIASLVRSVRGLRECETLYRRSRNRAHSFLFIGSSEGWRYGTVYSDHTTFSFRREGTHSSESGYTRHAARVPFDVIAGQRSVAARLLIVSLFVVSGTARTVVYESDYFCAPG